MTTKYSDPDSERCIIAAMMDDENSLIEAITYLTENDFTERMHYTTFQAMKSLYTQTIKPTFLEVLKEGLKNGTITTDEERNYLTKTRGYHVTNASMPYWIKNVREKSKFRKISQFLTTISSELENGDNADKLISKLEAKVMTLRTENCENADTGKDLADLGRKIFRENKEKKGQLIGIHTGIGKLNRLTGGWKDGDLILLAGETGKGKTTFAQNFISCACFVHAVPTVYINSEMSRRQVITRFGAITSSVPSERIKFGEQTEKDDMALESAMQFIENAPFYHYFMPSLDLSKASTAIRKEKIQHDIKFVVIDYVGRMDKITDDLKEWQVLEGIVRAMKTLAQELSIAIMILAQLNDDQRLQGAKRMENEADIFIKIAPLTPEEIDAITGRFRIQPNYKAVVKKNRDGESGVVVPVFFKKETQEIMDVANV